MNMRASSLAFAAALLTASPVDAQILKLTQAEVESDPTADFAAFKTFAWKDTQVPAANPTVHTNVVWYVERGLQGKGLKKVAADADLLLRYYSSASESLKSQPTEATAPPSGATTSGSIAGGTTRVDVHKERRASLVLEMYRASDGVLVWKGATPGASFDKDRLDSEVSAAVKLLLAKYPPKPAAR
ncbi:MAG: DUF4136 domain-containing protein [Vicinamibacteria bacterium]|nr:DUF4136 domain-containing protein [Vicinamibacteria bacterium]